MHVREYQSVLADALQELDAKRLEYDEEMFPGQRKPIAGFHKGTAYKETYVPTSDIAQYHSTRRVYGVMAGFDEPQKIITGLQLKQQGIIDTQTLQENMDGLDNITKIQQRISAEKAETVLFESLMAQAAQGNPKATIAAIEIRKNPQKNVRYIRLNFIQQRVKNLHHKKKKLLVQHHNNHKYHKVNQILLLYLQD